MKPEKLVEVLSVAERLKDAVRHSYISGGRRESVAEHSWRITLMADLLKIMEMCLIQHNKSDIKTWIPLEYDLQMT